MPRINPNDLPDDLDEFEEGAADHISIPKMRREGSKTDLFKYHSDARNGAKNRLARIMRGKEGQWDR